MVSYSGELIYLFILILYIIFSFLFYIDKNESETDIQNRPIINKFMTWMSYIYISIQSIFIIFSYIIMVFSVSENNILIRIFLPLLILFPLFFILGTTLYTTSITEKWIINDDDKRHRLSVIFLLIFFVLIVAYIYSKFQNDNPPIQTDTNLIQPRRLSMNRNNQGSNSSRSNSVRSTATLN